MARKYIISSGKENKAIKLLLYGTPGVGKSKFASQIDDSLCIDTEGSTGELDVKRLPKPSSWSMLLDEIDYVADEKPCSTLVVDTIDWAEKLCIDEVLMSHDWKGVEDAGWGSGYKYIHEEFSKIFTHLDKVINRGINVILLAHSMVNKFEMPDDQGSYDRYTLKLMKTPKCDNPSLIIEWADMVLFANFRTVIVKDEKTKKNKGLNGQQRIIYTQRTAAWDAKNRYDLPFEIPFEFPFDWKYLPMFGRKAEQNKPVKEHEQQRFNYETGEINVTDGMDEEPPRIVDLPPVNEGVVYQEIKEKYPALYDLMRANSIKEEDIRRVSASKGYFTEDTPIINYPDGYIAHIMQYKDEFIKLAKK